MRDNEPGLLFAAAAQAKLYAEVNGMPLEEAIQAKGFGLDSHVAATCRLMKAAVPAASTTGSGWIESLIQPAGVVISDFYDYLRTRSLLEKLGTGNLPAARTVEFRKPWVEKVTQASASWVGEGQPKPFTSFQLADKTLDPKKIVAGAAITDEAIEDSSLDALRMIRDELTNALVIEQSRTFLDPNNAGSATVPASITYGATALTPATSYASSQAAADIEKMVGAAITKRKTAAGLVLVVGSVLFWQLSTARNSLTGELEYPNFAGAPVVMGVPVVVDESLDELSVVLSDGSTRHTAVLFAPQDIVFGRSANPAADLRVKQSDQATVRLDTDPANSTTWTSLWQENMVGILVERRTNWTVARQENSTIVMTGIDWSNTASTP